MARISTYPKDLDVSDGDAWIGSNAPDGATKQFTAKAVADYLNRAGKISISAQMTFRYFPGAAPGSGDFYGPTVDSPIASITTMQLSKNDVSGQNVVAFMDYIVGNDILISEQSNTSSFGHFTIDSYTINDPDDDFYTLNLTNIAGNGTLKELPYYNFALFTPVGDKSFTFTQSTPSTSWAIEHNLNKFPSVSVVNNNNVLMYGEITYTDLNNLTINFSAGFSGKVYLN